MQSTCDCPAIQTDSVRNHPAHPARIRQYFSLFTHLSLDLKGTSEKCGEGCSFPQARSHNSPHCYFILDHSLTLAALNAAAHSNQPHHSRRRWAPRDSNKGINPVQKLVSVLTVMRPRFRPSFFDTSPESISGLHLFIFSRRC